MIRRVVAVVGTAGREPSHVPRLQRLYPQMVQAVREHVTPDDVLQSGGAAWADHVAVTLYSSWLLQELSPRINLFLPCEFDFQTNRFVGLSNVAFTANYYHGIFSQHMGFDSLLQLAEVLQSSGCVYETFNGFFARNLEVGKCDLLFAQTFASGKYPADGGTAHCWKNSRAFEKIHLSLSQMEATHDS